MPIRTMHDSFLQRIPKGAAEARTILPQRRGGYIMTFCRVSHHLAGVVGTQRPHRDSQGICGSQEHTAGGNSRVSCGLLHTSLA